MSIPFLQRACMRFQVTLVAKAHAEPLLTRFAPEVKYVKLEAPWTRFRGKYRLHQWPWRELTNVRRLLRQQSFDFAVSARPDPRDHLLMALCGCGHRIGFPRAGSEALLHIALPRPQGPHRADRWDALSTQLVLPPPIIPPQGARGGRRIAIHTGAAQPTRRWPRDRFDVIARRLAANGWEVTVLDDIPGNLEKLVNELAGADYFIGNDSGPGHVAALLGVPTFTIFGAALPEHFAPLHPQRGVIAGAACIFKPCQDSCRFAQPYCILNVEVEQVWGELQAWLSR